MSGRAEKWTGFISRLILFLMTDTARDYKILTTTDTNGMDDLFEQSGSDIAGPDRTGLDNPPTPAIWLTLSEAATVLNVNERTLRRWIKQGKIEAQKVQGAWGEQWRIRPGHNQSVSGSDIAGPDRASPDNPPTPDLGLSTPDLDMRKVVEMEIRLQLIEQENFELKSQLQGATFRNGYLEGQLETERQQVKLLTDSKHRSSWWQKLKENFSK